MNKKQNSASYIVNLLKRNKGDEWIKIREKTSLQLFHKASLRVPAYKKYLKTHKIFHEKIRTWQDFQHVPPINKKNYLTQYPLQELCWDGTLKKPYVFTATSGSTGDPFYFVRQNILDWQYSVIIENFLAVNKTSTSGPVLVVICFGMGLWIGGIITYKAFELSMLRNNSPLSIITPGINKKEIFNALKILSPHYQQTLLIGYPPLIKDIIDEAPAMGISLKSLHMRFLFAAEAISERFRDYIVSRTNVDNMYNDTINIYGSADIGAMAAEHGVSILVKRLALKNKQLFTDIFSPIQKTPTLAQYNPLFINFEANKGEILLTGDSAIPLIRYGIGDHGGVLSFPDVQRALKKNRISLPDEIEKAHIKNSYNELPFVYVYERVDLSATFYGLWIYPEWIRETLLIEPISNFLTGKFTLLTGYNSKQNQTLEINLELKKHMRITEATKKQILLAIVKSLRMHSSEYQELTDKLKEQAYPKLLFWMAGDQTHFQPGIKQKWVKKS